jgi:hypothetical protein
VATCAIKGAIVGERKCDVIKMQGMTIKNEIPSFFESTTKSIEG